MKSFRKVLPIVLVVVMIFALVLTGCGTKTETPTTSTAKTTTAVATKVEEKIKMTMFMGNSGLAHPDGVNASDNPWVNIIEKYANVDLEIEVPGYADYATKLNLLLSSGSLPDLVHSWVLADTMKRAEEGAFIDLKAYYDKSALIKKYITPEMLELTVSPVTKKYYRIPMAYWKGPQGYAVETRWDLVKKYNNGKWPTSVPEWIDLMKALKKAEPTAIPMSNRVSGANTMSYGTMPVYFWYGAMPNADRYEFETGKVVNTFTLPEYKAATLVMKQLFDEGLLDKEFATTDLAKWSEKWNNNSVLFMGNTLEQFTPNVQIAWRTGTSAIGEKTKTWEVLAAPTLKTFPAELKNVKYAEPYMGMPITSHGVYISTSSKNQDRAFRVIEGFTCDELYQAIFWGTEGDTYKVVNNVRIPDAAKLADTKRYWSLHLALVFGFVDGQDVKVAIGEAGTGKEYSDLVWNSIKPIDTAAKAMGLNPVSFIVSSDAAKLKVGDATALVYQSTVELIMGKITPAQFDAKVAEYTKTYGFIYDEKTKWIADNKADLVKKGVKIPLK